MNAVNLLPPDLRRGTGAPSRSGAAVYLVLGALGVAVVLVAITALLGNRVTDREAALAQAEAEAIAAEQQAASIAHYQALASATSSRVRAVRDVAAGRVVWAKSLTQVSRAIGTKVTFKSLVATSSSAGTSGGNPLRAAIDTPALEVSGCAENHPAVARLIARFRAMEGVQRVSLSSTNASDGAASTDSGGSSSTCAAGLPAKFEAVVFLKKTAASAAATATTGASTAASTANGGN